MKKIQILMRQVAFLITFFVVGLDLAFGQVMPADSFAIKLKATSKPQLIDVRTQGEFAGGHLVAAKNINVKDADFAQQIEKLDKTKPIFVYCLSGGRSKTANEIFVKNGFNQVYELKGGYLNWSVNKMPTEGTIEPKTNLGRFTIEEINAIIKDNKIVLVDYFAVWCGPCKKMNPAIERLKNEFEGKAKIVKIDTDKNKTIAIQNLVNEIPTFIFYKNGKEFWRGTGEQDEEFLRELFELNVGK